MSRFLPRFTHHSAAALLTAVLSTAVLAATPTGSGDPTSSDDRIARALAGVGVKKSVDSDEMVHYAARVDAAWTRYTARIGTPMSKWGLSELKQPMGGTVFYPFSGPDLPTVYQFYPNADRYVLVAIQPATRPIDLGGLSTAHRKEAMSILQTSWSKFGTLGFFRTDDLDENVHQEKIAVGPSTVLAAFASRMGYTVDSIEPTHISPQTGEIEVLPRDTHHWSSVRLSLSHAQRHIIVDYVKLDLSDAGLHASPEGARFIDAMSHNPTLLKAASHLPQDPKFLVIRQAMLQNAPTILQDETGLDYTLLAQKFDVKLYGDYTHANKLFKTLNNPSLAQAYRNAKNVKPMPFKVGYEKDSGSAVQVATRMH
ncbi:MAG: hypothetical protein JO142_17825 [Burkholderiales bacterium]|nr:hypothetical protein [Burkholderiales bacterium]